MTSESTDFFPPFLKWASIACFSLLAGGLVFSYLTSPKLILDDYATAQQLEAEDLIATEPLSTLSQSSESAEPTKAKTLSEQSSAQQAEVADSPSVQSVEDGGGEADEPVATSQVSQKNSTSVDDSSSKKRNSATSKGKKECKQEIIGLYYKPEKRWVYYVRHWHTEYNVMLQKFPGARKFCSEGEARKAGYSAALSRFVDYFNNALGR